MPPPPPPLYPFPPPASPLLSLPPLDVLTLYCTYLNLTDLITLLATTDKQTHALVTTKGHELPTQVFKATLTALQATYPLSAPLLTLLNLAQNPLHTLKTMYRNAKKLGTFRCKGWPNTMAQLGGNAHGGAYGGAHGNSWHFRHDGTCKSEANARSRSQLTTRQAISSSPSGGAEILIKCGSVSVSHLRAEPVHLCSLCPRLPRTHARFARRYPDVRPVSRRSPVCDGRE